MYYSVLDCAKHLTEKHNRHVDQQAVRYLYTHNHIPAPAKVGRNRFLTMSDIERIEKVFLDRWAAK